MRVVLGTKRVAMTTQVALYTVAFVAIASALIGGCVGHSVMKPKAEGTVLAVCEKTGGLFGINCW